MLNQDIYQAQKKNLFLMMVHASKEEHISIIIIHVDIYIVGIGATL